MPSAQSAGAATTEARNHRCLPCRSDAAAALHPHPHLKHSQSRSRYRPPWACRIKGRIASAFRTTSLYPSKIGRNQAYFCAGGKGEQGAGLAVWAGAAGAARGAAPSAARTRAPRPRTSRSRRRASSSSQNLYSQRECCAAHHAPQAGLMEEEESLASASQASRPDRYTARAERALL